MIDFYGVQGRLRTLTSLKLPMENGVAFGSMNPFLGIWVVLMTPRTWCSPILFVMECPWSNRMIVVMVVTGTRKHGTQLLLTNAWTFRLISVFMIVLFKVTNMLAECI